MDGPPCLSPAARAAASARPATAAPWPRRPRDPLVPSRSPPRRRGRLQGGIAFGRDRGKLTLLLFNAIFELLDHAVLRGEGTSVVGKRCVLLCQHHVAGGKVVREGCCGRHARTIPMMPMPPGRTCRKTRGKRPVMGKADNACVASCSRAFRRPGSRPAVSSRCARGPRLPEQARFRTCLAQAACTKARTHRHPTTTP